MADTQKMIDTIPKNVDCIILGTGLTNSILAAACSRIGKSVLHIDKNSYYGEEWASFTFQQLIDWIKENHPGDESLENIPEEVNSKSRFFCIDLCPRLLFSNGPMVDLLVKSNVSRYHEFKNNIRILSMIGDEIHVMPCRRSEVFTSSLLPDLVEKRKLMQFIELCIKNESEGEISQNFDVPINKFLDDRGLGQKLKDFIINSIAMVEPTDSVGETAKQIRSFMVAIERFGKSPFLFPLYGCGEFPQSFCRLSAVFGGVYCLNTKIDNIKISDNFTIKLSDKDCEVTSDRLVMDYNSAKTLNIACAPRIREKTSRAILITRNSIKQNDEKLNSFMRLPPSELNEYPIYILEVNSTFMVCPPDLNIVYLWTRSTKSAKCNLKPTVDKLFRDDVLWSFYYHQLSEPRNNLLANSIPNFHVTSPPSNDIDYRNCIAEAEKIFNQLCPGEEFLPRAPDPDEIVIE